MISPHRIKYNGIESTELNLIELIMCVAFDSDNGETSAYLNREAVVSETYDGRYKRVHRYKYNESFSPKFTFMKKDFGNFTMEEVRRILKWLTSADTTALLDVYYDDSDVIAWSVIGGWTEINTYKLANNRTVGITATFEAITPYAMSKLYTVTKTISSADNNKITIEIDTDDNKPVYPRITINHGYDDVPHTVVRIPDEITYTSLLDMTDKVENTAYFNGTTYYWKATEPTKSRGNTKPQYKDTETGEIKDYDWPIVNIDHAYTDNDTWENNTIYLYDDNGNKTYFWIDPYNFHTETADNPPNLSTTSVKIINQHTDLFNQPSTPAITIVKNNTSTERVVLDGANKIVSTDRTRRIFGDDFNWQWLELYDGKNEITIEGNCEVILEYRTVVKCGEY